MMSDFEILQELFRDEALATVEYEYDKKVIVLKETGKGGNSGQGYGVSPSI